jgi:hypothetical protein
LPKVRKGIFALFAVIKITMRYPIKAPHVLIGVAILTKIKKSAARIFTCEGNW